jgi:hypothetical protein
MMSGTSFTNTYAAYYRPITVLSFGIGHHIWGLSPHGYHLTSLVLHVFVSLLVSVLTLRLTKGSLGIAWLAGVIFATHPSLVESVPAIARRQEALASLMILISFILYLKNSPNRIAQKGYYISSILVFMIGLGSHEIGAVLPLLLMAYEMIYTGADVGSFRERFSVALKRCAPFFIWTGIYMVWRGYVLGGMGGGIQKQSVFMIFIKYILGLVYPVDFLGLNVEVMYSKSAEFRLAVGILAVGVLVSLFLSLKHFRESAWHLISSNESKVFVLMCFWLMMPLGLFVVSGTFARRNIYLAVLPFSILLAVVIGSAFRPLWEKGNLFQIPNSIGDGIRVMSGIGGTLLCASLIFFSPAFQSYDEWRDSAKVSEMFFHQLETIADRIPANSTIEFIDLPWGIVRYDNMMVRAKTVSYLTGYSIKSWIDMVYPNKKAEVRVKSYRPLEEMPSDLRIEIIEDGNWGLKLRVKAKG